MFKKIKTTLLLIFFGITAIFGAIKFNSTKILEAGSAKKSITVSFEAADSHVHVNDEVVITSMGSSDPFLNLLVSSDGTISIHTASSYPTLPTITYDTGYSFDYCKVDNVQYDGVNKSTPVIKSNTTIYFYSKMAGYTITYDTDGGDYIDSLSSQSSLPSPLPTPIKNGYLFDGWYTDEGLNTSAVAGASISQDTILYASWIDLAYSKTFDISITELEYDISSSNIEITVDDADLEIVDFKLWNTVDGNTYNVVNTITGTGVYTLNIIVKGKTKDFYFENETIGFDYGYKGSISLSDWLDYYQYATKHYGVSSYNIDDKDCFDSSNVSSFAYENTYLGLNINFRGYQMVYEKNTDDKSVSNLPEDNNLYLNKTPITISTTTPVREGYKFLGWNTDENATTSLAFTNGKYTVDKDNIEDVVSLYAIWAKECLVTYDLNNGNGTIPTINDKYAIGDTIELPNGNEITKEGYSFAGWNTNSNSAIANNGAYTIVATDVIDDAIKFYAIWGHSCEGLIYSGKLDSTFTGGELASGYYYLDSDITLTSDIEIADNAKVYICLNGHILNLNGNQLYSYNAVLEIGDCNDDVSIHNYKVNEYGLWTLTDEEATKNVDSLSSIPATNDVVLVKGGAIVGGCANQYGGAIYSKDFKAYNVSFVGNYSIEEYSKKGGAIFAEKAYIINCNFYGNRSIEGSAIYGGNLTIYDSTFKFNKTFETYVFGDGLCGGNGTIFSDGKLLLKDSILQYNSSINGGAIFLNGDYVISTIIGSTITNNIALDKGAGICFGDTGCFKEGTLITMGNDSTKNIEDINVGDFVKSFNHEKGVYESQEVYYVYSNCEQVEYFTLNFESGNTLTIADCHDLFNKELSKYVTINSNNYSSFIDKYFYNTTLNSNNGDWDKLVSVDLFNGVISYYSIYVGYTHDCIANGYLTCSDDVDFRLNIYEFGNDLVANNSKLQEDINTYGIIELDDCKLVETQKQYEMFSIKYYNIYVGKGLISKRELNNLFYEMYNYDEYTKDEENLTLIIGKNTTITNNKVGNNENNVYLKNGATIKVIDGAKNINVGVTLENDIGIFANNVYANNISFTSDNSIYGIKKTVNGSKYDYSISIIKEEPSKDNDYTVVIDDSIKDDYTYQWYEGYSIDANEWKNNGVDYTDYETMTIDGNNKVYSSIESSLSMPAFNNYYEHIILRHLSEGDIVTFTMDEDDIYTLNDSLCDGFTYSVDGTLVTLVVDSDCFVLICKHSSTSFEDASFTLSNIVIKHINKLDGETDSKFNSTTLIDSTYYCEVLDNEGFVVEVSEIITPNLISFNGGKDATGNDPDDIYQFEGRKITIPSNPYTKEGYNFLGWNTSSTATSALTLTNNQYKVGSSDTTLYAIWEEKTKIEIDTDLQRIIYNGSSITPVLKDTSGDLITITGFSYTYEMYYQNEYGSCLDTKEPGLYKVHIQRDEDEDYNAVDTYIEFVVTYSLTYKANTGVGADVIDYISDNDTIHKDYYGAYCDVTPDTYRFDSKAIIKANTFTKDNYTFAFWNTKADGTGNTYNPDDLLTLTNNTILYACYSANISAQPSKDNNYTVSVATTDNVTYEWEKITKIIEIVDLATLKNVIGNINSNEGKITAINQGTYYQIIIPAKINRQLMFNTDGVLNDGIEGVNNTYIYNAKIGRVAIYNITSNNEFSISNVKYYSVDYAKINNETTNKINNATENTSYRCVIKSAFNAITYSSKITTKSISFNGGENITGTAPSTIYQLEGREITLPENSFTKTGYKFIGWNTTNTATTKIDSYKVGSTNATLYAIWQEKANVSINEIAQSYSYNATSQAFEIKGTNKDLDDFVIRYAHYNESHDEADWQDNAPTDVDNYDVKIIRLEDDDYKAYSIVITNGLVISKYVVKDSDISLATNNFTYNGTDQSNKLIATYKDALGNDVSLLLVDFTPRTNPKSDITYFKDASIYDVCFMFDSEAELLNYVFESSESEYFYTEYEIKAKEVTINWINDDFTYNGETQTITATYKDINNDDIDLEVTVDEFKNAGAYTATVSFANYETNYKLPTLVTKSYTIKQIKVSKPTKDERTFTFDGNEKTYTLEENDLYSISNNTRVYAGSQTVTVSLDDKTNYCWDDSTTTDLTFTFSINKAKATITVDQTTISKTYGEEIILPTATTTFGEVSCDKVLADLVNANTYTVTYSVTGTDNYEGDTKSLTVIISKLKVNEPIVIGTYKFTGSEQTILLSGVESYMVTTDSLTKTNPGVYTITYTLDNNHQWEDGNDGIVNFEIKPLEITPIIDPAKEIEKQDVIVSTDNGFSNDITVTVEVTVEVEIESKQLTVDYYNISEEASKLNDNEKVGVVFDVKLIQTIDGVSREIQPEDIAPGTTIKVKMLIPESVDISKVTRILHVHNTNDIETIEFDSSLVDENGYYEIEVNRLSEFAFIYEKDNTNCYIHWFLLGLMIIALAYFTILFIVLNMRSFTNKDGKLNLFIVLGLLAYAICLVILSALSKCSLCYIFDGLNSFNLVLIILLYTFYKENDISIKESTLKESIEKASNIVNKTLKINKKEIADYLENKYKDNVIVNRRNNYIKSGYLPLADTHYKVNNDKKTCFVYVYELKNGNVMLLIKTKEELANKIAKIHNNINKSLFPISTNSCWYSLAIDNSFKTNNDVFDIIDLVYNNL